MGFEFGSKGQTLRDALPFRLVGSRIASRLAILLGGIIGTCIMLSIYTIPEIPAVSLQYPNQSPYNESKVALLIENRPLNNLAPLVTHFISVIPPEWKFMFLGNEDSINHIKKSATIQRQAEIGKLEFRYIPSNMSVNGQEAISQFFTDLYVYQTLLAPAEWLLVFQTDSMLCGNTLGNLNDWLHYDWVGASWGPDLRYGGNGGLSLRRVSKIIQVLQKQQREPDSELEDHWLTERLGHLIGGKVANGTEEMAFSGELVWNENQPMGYHTGWSGKLLMGGLFGTQKKRETIFKYCPELQMVLDMDHQDYFGGRFCNQEWA